MRQYIVKVRRVPRLKATFVGIPKSVAEKIKARYMKVMVTEDGTLTYIPIQDGLCDEIEQGKNIVIEPIREKQG